MTITCPECNEVIDNDNKAQISSIVKKGKCPHCSKKVDIDADRWSLIKPGLPFVYALIVNFIVFMILQKGFIVCHIINITIVFFILSQKFKIRERALLAKGLKRK